MTGNGKTGIGKFVILPKETVVINTLVATGTAKRELVLEETAVAIVDAAGRHSASFSVVLFRKGRNKHFLREEVAFHTLVAQPLSAFQTFVAFADAEKGL